MSNGCRRGRWNWSNAGLRALTHCIWPVRATVTEAVQKMCSHKVGALLVCDGDRPVAMFTERDLMSRVVMCDWDPKRTLVRDVMTPDIVTIRPDTDAGEAMKLMTLHRCRHLAIVASGRLVGIVSMGDLVRQAGREQLFELSMLRDAVTYGN